MSAEQPLPLFELKNDEPLPRDGDDGGDDEPRGWQHEVDRLIDWYELHKPGAGAEIRLNVVRATVMRAGVKPAERGGPIVYRGRTLVTKDEWSEAAE